MIEQILKLIDAGFTKEEIAAMMKPSQAEPIKEAPAEIPAEPEKTAAPVAPSPEQAPEAAPARLDEYISKLINDKYAEAEKKIIDEMAKKINVFSIPEVKPITDISDIITNFFKED